MCGIYGCWQRDQRPLDLAQFARATTALQHRGPDDEGYLLINTGSDRTLVAGGSASYERLSLPPLAHYQGENFDLAFGFRRLAILDLSPAGHQPMRSQDGRYWIIFNGEVYNYLELRQELAGYGHTFQSGSDTEVILAAYAQWGVACLQRFNGMWALAIWDRQQQQLFLARDRFGVKPLYYTQQNQTLAFASEIKALVGPHGIPFRPGEQWIYRYLLAGVLPNPQHAATFFEGVLALPPGHYMQVTPTQLQITRYWTVEYGESHPRVDTATTIAAYREYFTDAVRLRLRADVPIGTCLSGGLDSSAIVCTINQMLTAAPSNGTKSGPFQAGRQQTFSAVYDTPGRHNERSHIERVLSHVQQVQGHFTFPTAERLHAELAPFVWHQDEPTLSPSPFAQWCVMQKAHEQGITVLLDGQGADEALGGYRPYGVYLQALLRSAALGQFRNELSAIQQVTGLAASTLLQQTGLALLPDAPLMQLRKLGWQLRSAASLFRPEFRQRWANSIGADYPYESASNLSNHLHFRVQVGLPELLRYEDRNSMAHSIEARVPFLDYRLVQFSFNQAAGLRIHQGWTKWILRKAMEGVVPNEIVWRRDKVGFETPLQDWLRTLVQAQNWFDNQARSGAYLDLGRVRQQLPVLLAEGRPNRSQLWRLINLEVWLRVWQAAGAGQAAQAVSGGVVLPV